LVVLSLTFICCLTPPLHSAYLLLRFTSLGTQVGAVGQDFVSTPTTDVLRSPILGPNNGLVNAMHEFNIGSSNVPLVNGVTGQSPLHLRTPQNKATGTPGPSLTPINDLKTPVFGRRSRSNTFSTPGFKVQTGFSISVDPEITGPEESVTVRWVVPKLESHRSDWIGLYRVHQSDPESCMTSKYINLHQGNPDRIMIVVDEVSGREEEIEVIRGELYMRSPPAIGRYDFRYFQDIVAKRPGAGAKERRQKAKQSQRESGIKEEYVPPPAPASRSNMLTVEAQGDAFISALSFLFSRIENDGGQGRHGGRNNRKQRRNQPNLREYAGAVAQLVRLLEQLRQDWEGRRGKLTYAKQLWPAISMSVVKNFNHAQSTNSSSKTERDLASIGRTNRSLVGVATMNPAVRVMLNQTQLRQLSVWKERLLASDVVKGLTEQAERMKAPIRICRKDDHGKRLIVSTVDGPVLAHIKESRNEVDKLNTGSDIKKKKADKKEKKKKSNKGEKEDEEDEEDAVDSSFIKKDEATKETAPGPSPMSAFVDVPMFPEGINSDISMKLTEAINERSPTFMPSTESKMQRLELQQRLDAMLSEDLSGMPGARGVTLAVFGSSANGFGSSTSDLDMCLNFNDVQNHEENRINPQDLILKIAEILESRGMTKVDTSRVTARIPVIQFIDPVTGLDCDICINNQLALRNTKLLRSYSLFDTRVKLVAYVVKTWSKRRDLNCPERSTLSSYGFLLTLFMHLQRRILIIDRMLGEGNPSIKKQRNDELYHRPLLAHLQRRRSPNFDVARGEEQLPVVMTPTPDGSERNTYFFDPLQVNNGQNVVQSFAKKDTRTSKFEILLLN
jgi:hypothetical protein